MSNAVPEGWTAEELGDIAKKIEGGGTPPRTEPSYWAGNIPWATVKDLRGTALKQTEEFITETGLKNSSSKLIPAETMIIASRMAVGKAVFFDRDVAINQDLKAFYPRSDIDWRFLLQWYLSKSELVEGLATGSTVKGIRLEDLKALPIDVPPLPEQQKIAAILSSVDDVIEKTRAQIDKLKDLKTGMMQELLTKGIGHTAFKDSPVGRIPEGWDVLELGEIAKVKGGKRMPKGRPFADHTTPHPYIRVSDFANGTISLDNLKYVLPKDQESIKRYTISKDDLYISIAGTIGVVGSVPEVLDGAQLTENAAKIVFNDLRGICVSFVKHLMCSNEVQDRLNQEKGTGGGVPKLALFRIESTLIQLPPFPEQKAIGNALDSIDHRLDSANQKLSALEMTKKALMQDLLTGKVRVNVDNKENAVA